MTQEFTFDTTGAVERGAAYGGAFTWDEFDACAQGYTVAVFHHLFTFATHDCDGPLGFDRLAPEAVTMILADCSAFQRMRSDPATTLATQKFRGMSFFEQRNSGWPSWPLMRDDLAAAFPPVTVSLGADGKVHLAVAA